MTWYELIAVAWFASAFAAIGGEMLRKKFA